LQRAQAVLVGGEIVDDFPDLTEEDIRACPADAADREQHTLNALTPHEAAVRP
jgi:uncharacterized protein (DUF433 family)